MEESYVKQKIFDLLIEDPSAICMIKSKYLTDDVWKFCIEQEPSLFKYMKYPTNEMCDFAVSLDGKNLRYVRKKKIPITPKMAYLAIKNDPNAIFEVPNKMVTPALKELAYDQKPELVEIYGVPSNDYIRRCIKDQKYNILNYIPEPDETVMLEALDENPLMCRYINHLTDAMKALIREKYPHFVPLLPQMKEDCENTVQQTET